MGPRKWFDRSFPLILSALIIFTLAGCNLPGIEKSGSFDPAPGKVVTGSTATPFQPLSNSMTPIGWDDVLISNTIEDNSTPTDIPTLTATSSPTLTPSATITPAPTETPTLIPTTEADTVVTPEPSETPTQVIFPTPTLLTSPTIIPTPIESYPWTERTKYDLNVTINYDGHVVNVSEKILYTNHTGSPLSYLLLGVNANLWQNTFQLYSIRLNGSAQTYYELNGQNLSVYPGQPILQDETIQLELEYQLNLPYSAGKLENFGYTTRQMNLIDWYPFIPPFKNGQWLLPAPYTFGENLVYEKADFKVDLAVTNAAWQPVVAGSSFPNIDNYGYHFQFDNARNFTLSLSPEFQVLSDYVNGVELRHYYFPENANAAEQVLFATKQAVATYSEAFGPYPHSALTIVETELNDGLEVDGLYFLSRSFYQAYAGGYKNNLFVIAIHETAHQWWYGGVGSDQANEPWLDEALCTYSERVFFARNYPDDLQWWWNFRVYSHAVNGYVDSRIYDHSLYSQYVSAVYFNGVEFLDLLRQRVGSDNFSSFLWNYYNTYSGKIVTADDFFNKLYQYAGQDFNDIVQSYFYYR